MQTKNKKVSVSFIQDSGMGRDYISIDDLTDNHNETQAFTKNVRGIKKAWAFIEHIFQKEELKDDLDFWDIIKILDEKFNLNTHTYCGLD